MDPATDSYETDVSVQNGVVTLRGQVESWQEKELSEKVTKGVTGVKSVNNRLEIHYKDDRPDTEIKAEVERSLAMDPWIGEHLIQVEVEDGRVKLTGTVGSATERYYARSRAWVSGVNEVDLSGLEVQTWARDEMQREGKHALISDGELEKAVEKAFFYDPRVKSFNPEITVTNGVVTLSGKVDNLKAKRAAEEDARNTIGVWRVVNNLRVRPVILLSNSKVESDIVEALKRDPFVERHQIGVNVINGKAYLYGKVDSYFEKQQAEDAASRVNGVVTVDNNLDVDYTWRWRSDAEIAADIESELTWSPFVDEDQVNVTVNDGVAVLTGSVDSWAERGAATENAFDGGAKAVRNKLKVNGYDAVTELYYPSYEHFVN
jgi:osmotically-inducible protein OsmY